MKLFVGGNIQLLVCGSINNAHPVYIGGSYILMMAAISRNRDYQKTIIKYIAIYTLLYIEIGGRYGRNNNKGTCRRSIK